MNQPIKLNRSKHDQSPEYSPRLTIMPQEQIKVRVSSRDWSPQPEPFPGLVMLLVVPRADHAPRGTQDWKREPGLLLYPE